MSMITTVAASIFWGLTVGNTLWHSLGIGFSVFMTLAAIDSIIAANK